MNFLPISPNEKFQLATSIFFYDRRKKNTIDGVDNKLLHKNKTEFHVDNSLTENAHTFDEEFSGTFGNSGRISCSAREYAGVFSQHFSDGKHELVALAQHLIAHDISQQCHTRCSRQLPKVLTVQILTVQILSGHQ